MSEIDDRIDAVLAQGPVWEPPAEFARTVAASASRPMPHRSRRRRISTSGVVDLALPGLLVAAAGWVVGLTWDALVVDVVTLAWLCAALGLGAGALFARRALA